MSVSLRNPVTGEVKVLQDGWSWACLFGSGALGLPLFKRGLTVWGSAMLVFDIVGLIVGWIPTGRAAGLYAWLTMIGIGASVFFAMKANGMAVQHALDTGWVFADRRREWFD